ncbi:MAG: CPBP family intramembrane metalloprotease [Lachnospiraceae bacterium]|nr:CPBP family intramembrane metalloprotease [Lachnospiraceae bacterium]
MLDMVKNRKHVITDKLPIFVAIILMYIGTFVPNIVLSGLVEDVFSFVNKIDLMEYVSQTGDVPAGLMPSYYVISIIFSFVFLLIFEWWFKPEYDGSMHIKGIKEGMIFSLPVIIFWVVWYVIEIAIGQCAISLNGFGDTIVTLLQGFRAGVVEEVAYRAIGLAIFIRYFKKMNNIWMPTVLAGVLFGLTHLVNIFSDGDPLEVIVQTVFATCFGVIFCLIFTCSGNIWAPVIVHSLYDASTFGIKNLGEGGSWTNVVDVAGMFVLMIVLFVVFMKRKESVLELWNTKWK